MNLLAPLRRTSRHKEIPVTSSAVAVPLFTAPAVDEAAAANKKELEGRLGGLLEIKSVKERHRRLRVAVERHAEAARAVGLEENGVSYLSVMAHITIFVDRNKGS